MGKQPWNDWYHVTIHTYGSWLRGDPRGWRSRHHREHVDGDYKNPPPKGKYDELYELSKSLMTRDPVRIAKSLREFVVARFVERLLWEQIEVLVCSADATHVHVLARFPDHSPRHWTGLSKKHTSHSVRQEGLRDTPGGLWAKRGSVKPIADRGHQLATFNYIWDHRLAGAAVWTFRR
jgi:hypothetical protein